MFQKTVKEAEAENIGGWGQIHREMGNASPTRKYEIKSKMRPSVLLNRLASADSDASCHRIFRYVPQCHSRSFETTPFNRSHTSSFWRSIVTMALSCITSKIGGAENDGHEIAGHENDGPSSRA